MEYIFLLLLIIFYFRIFYSICTNCGKTQKTENMVSNSKLSLSEEKLFKCKKCLK